MTKKRNGRRRTLITTLVVITLVVAAFLFVPTGKYVEVPGSASVTSKFVHVAGEKDRQPGSYRLMTVSIIGPATPAILLWAHWQPFAEVDSKSDLMGNATTAEYNALQRYYIKSAANAAVVAAMRAARRPVKVHSRGIYVMSLLRNSPLKGHVRPGDVITKINGQQYQRASGYTAAIARLKVGERVRVTYTHRGRQHNVTVKLVRLTQTHRAGIGITLTDRTAVTSTPHVRIDAGDIGGPSAGLIFALETYQQVTGDNLRNGRIVAGTGTIDEQGKVGAIGGIDKKVSAAAKAGATIFFAPDVPATRAMLREDPHYVNNYVVARRAAKKIGTKMRIVPVRSLQQAISYLRTHK